MQKPGSILYVADRHYDSARGLFAAQQLRENTTYGCSGLFERGWAVILATFERAGFVVDYGASIDVSVPGGDRLLSTYGIVEDQVIRRILAVRRPIVINQVDHEKRLASADAKHCAN